MILRLHHIAHWLWRNEIPLLPWLIKIFLRIVFGLVLPPSVRVGRGVLFSYQGLGTVIHKEAEIGNGAIIATCVTIGGRSGMRGAPVIGEGALIGTGAKVLGPIHIGQFASVGANAVVLEDIPPYAIAVGIPAKVVKFCKPDERPQYDSFI